MKLGYSDDSTAKTLTIYLKYLDKHLHVLPGEGARILSLVSDVINFIATINTIGTREISISIMQIVDKILTYQHSLVRESVSHNYMYINAYVVGIIYAYTHDGLK